MKKLVLLSFLVFTISLGWGQAFNSPALSAEEQNVNTPTLALSENIVIDEDAITAMNETDDQTLYWVHCFFGNSTFCFGAAMPIYINGSFYTVLQTNYAEAHFQVSPGDSVRVRGVSGQCSCVNLYSPGLIDESCCDGDPSIIEHTFTITQDHFTIAVNAWDE